MDLFEQLAEANGSGGGYQSLHFFQDRPSQLRALVAIHNTARGPALGGTRALATYASEDAAVTDVLRLARGMTYKAALAGLKLGGGKAVILLPRGPFDRAALFAAFGKAVDSLAGRYITTEDSGTSPDDMRVVAQHTRFVLGTPQSGGGSGDPSPVTAYGCLRGILAVAKTALGKSELGGLRVSVLGVGHVGFPLAKLLVESGATVTVADVDPLRVKAVASELACGSLAVDQIVDEPCDIFSPNALGAVLNDGTIARLRCRAVAGAANNQLAEPRHAQALQDRGILYAPDYAINAGGLINVASELNGHDPAAVQMQASAIYDTLIEIFGRAQRTGRTTAAVADQLAEERFLQH